MDAAAQKTALSQSLGQGGGTEPGQYRALQQDQVPSSVTHSPRSASAVHCTQQQQLPCSPPCLFPSHTERCYAHPQRLSNWGLGHLSTSLVSQASILLGLWLHIHIVPLALLGAKNKANSSIHICGQKYSPPSKLQSADDERRNKTRSSPTFRE